MVQSNSVFLMVSDLLSKARLFDIILRNGVVLLSLLGFSVLSLKLYAPWIELNTDIGVITFFARLVLGVSPVCFFYFLLNIFLDGGMHMVLYCLV